MSFWKYKVLPQRLRGILTTTFERHLPVEDFTDMDQHRCRIYSSKSIAPTHLTYYCVLLLLSHKPRDDTHMKSMKIVQFSRPTTPLPIYVQNYSTPWPWTSNFKWNPLPSPNDNQSVKRKQNPKMTIRAYQVLPSFTFSRRLQDVLPTGHLAKMSSKHLQDVLKTFWRRIENILKTFCQDLLKTSCKDVFKTFSKRLQDVTSS